MSNKLHVEDEECRCWIICLLQRIYMSILCFAGMSIYFRSDKFWVHSICPLFRKGRGEILIILLFISCSDEGRWKNRGKIFDIRGGRYAS